MWMSTMYPSALPEAGDEVLLVANGRVFSGYYAGYNGAHYVWKSSRNGFTYWDSEVTHWMPLPEPSKESDDCGA